MARPAARVLAGRGVLRVARRLCTEPTREEQHPMTAPEPEIDCDDVPKLTAEEWEAVTILSAEQEDDV
jgi:hypothetical protein